MEHDIVLQERLESSRHKCLHDIALQSAGHLRASTLGCPDTSSIRPDELGSLVVPFFC